MPNMKMNRHSINFLSKQVLFVNPTNTLARLHSQIANKEEPSKDNQNSLEAPSVVFKDVSFDQPVSHEALISALKKYNTIADQMSCLVDIFSLTPEDIQRREEFCKTVELLFKPFFNDFKIQMFGSTVNSFGFKGCDLDLTFETNVHYKDKSCYLERPDPPLVSEVLSGKVSVQELSELPLREQLLFIHSVLLEFYKDSEVPAKFINAHVPLVRFYHDKYNLKCDLTMKNKVAFANTKLLYLYAKLDERVTPLMMTLRYWAKHVELIGKGLMFNTYTISLLVIYFLQTRNPPILPSAEFILSLSDKFDTDDMKDRSFLDLIDSIPPTKNQQSIDDLLKEFFFFYLYFDFTRVICPMTATAVPRDDFFSKEENKRFRMNSICIQDPLCLSHNVAELVDYKHCKKFFTELIQVGKLFQNYNDSISNPLDLITILDKPKEYSIHKISNEKTVSFDLPLVSNTDIKPTDENVLSTAQDILNILQKVLLFDCRVLRMEEIISLLNMQDALVAQQRREWLDKIQLRISRDEAMPHLKNRRKKNTSDTKEDNVSNKDSLLDQFQKFNCDHKLVLCAECIVSKNTWLGRGHIHIASLPSSDPLVQEKLISEIVAKQNALNLTEQKIKPFLFLYESYISHLNPDKLMVNFRPLQRMSFNPILGIFLKEYINVLLKKLS
ncbi:poly(A) RNA polymerase, mitochondrial isoform X2 [Parasteatoda tepidariorum]|uniref:poly(A) RNA polymerase, mitochondrial isoform X2 n=1 Tax=Parasteatoda tepidariorum TaxID=114398 RepID=UPI00077F8B5D|nr:speckle targeted PIP5K1A-regulated poly(A) polymerase isoform X2 [Parasteatoda tepidariorum]